MTNNVLGISMSQVDSMRTTELESLVEAKLSRTFPYNATLYTKALKTWRGLVKDLAKEMARLKELPFEGIESKTSWVLTEHPSYLDKMKAHLSFLLIKQQRTVIGFSASHKRLNKLILETLLKDGYKVTSRTPTLNMLIFFEDRVSKSDTSFAATKRDTLINTAVAMTCIFSDPNYKRPVESGDISSLHTVTEAVDLLTKGCPVTFPEMAFHKSYNSYKPFIKAVSSVLETLSPEQLEELRETIKKNSTSSPNRVRGIDEHFYEQPEILKDRKINPGEMRYIRSILDLK